MAGLSHMTRGKLIGAIAATTALVAIAVFLWLRPRPEGPPPSIPAPSEAPEGLARRVAEVLYAERAQLALKPVPETTVYLALRKGGVRLAHGFAEGPDWPHAVLNGVTRLLDKRPSAAEADTLELCLPHSRSSVRLRSGKPPLGDAVRGVRGLELKHAKSKASRSICPTQAVADNLSFKTMLEDFGREHDLSADALIEEVEAEQYDAHQWLIQLDTKKAKRMFRGNELVRIEGIDTQSVKQLAAGMTTWMKTQVQPDGRMVYMYYPSRGEESNDGNNMIRQFMATLCLQRIANREQTEESRELALRNLHYNFSHFYLTEGDKGLIDERGKRKLGGIALAALSIIESPHRALFTEQEAALRRTVESLQNPDGGFRTFYGTNRNDNQNFYPGEALLMWAFLLEENPNDTALAKRFMDAFRYYRTWHRDNRNPAFIPWHTQAYYKVWTRTQDPELRDFMFEMNDWLSDFQQWDKAPYRDLRGRYYDPDRRELGPPHASSTGVYLEGLTDARMLARAVGDKEREQRYNQTIKRSLRSLMQLQFVNDVDTFYISKKQRVLGGVRTNEYDNAIRVDNVQHSLMGLQKLLADIAAGNAL
jgi:hypothetical protein